MRFGFNDKSFRPQSVYDSPQFKNLAKDEVARICCFDDPVSGVITLLAHRIQFGKDDKRSGYYRCAGRYEVFREKGCDSELCLACAKQAKLGPDVPGVAECKLRYATNIMVYLTDAKGMPRTPWAADCKAWIFGDDKCKRLFDIRDQLGHPEWGIRVLDLFVKCTQKQYQRYDIDPMRECLWMMAYQKQDMFYQQFLKSFQEGAQPEHVLEALMANTIDAQTMEKYIAEATGVGNPAIFGGPMPAATPQDLQRLLDESRPVHQQPGQLPGMIPPGPPPFGSPPPFGGPPGAPPMAMPPVAMPAPPQAYPMPPQGGPPLPLSPPQVTFVGPPPGSQQPQSAPPPQYQQPLPPPAANPFPPPQAPPAYPQPLPPGTPPAFAPQAPPAANPFPPPPQQQMPQMQPPQQPMPPAAPQPQQAPGQMPPTADFDHLLKLS